MSLLATLGKEYIYYEFKSKWRTTSFFYLYNNRNRLKLNKYNIYSGQFRCYECETIYIYKTPFNLKSVSFGTAKNGVQHLLWSSYLFGVTKETDTSSKGAYKYICLAISLLRMRNHFPRIIYSILYNLLRGHYICIIMLYLQRSKMAEWAVRWPAQCYGTVSWIHARWSLIISSLCFVLSLCFLNESVACTVIICFMFIMLVISAYHLIRILLSFRIRSFF